jgi:hypothetical protein
VIEERDVAAQHLRGAAGAVRAGLDEIIMVHFRLARPPAKLSPWKKMVEPSFTPRDT